MFWEVAERLGYHDNRLIYGIQTGRTKTIGVSMPLDIYFSRIHGRASVRSWKNAII